MSTQWEFEVDEDAPPSRGAIIVVALFLAVFWGLAVLGLFTLFSSLAHAGGVVAATVGTSASQVLAPATSPPRRLIVIDNESASASLACTLSGTPALNSAGSLTLAPASRFLLAAAGVVFWDSVSCVASAAGTPVTILWE